VVSECSLSGRGHGHASNFYIVDLENIATASRRYTDDIHNSVRSRFVYDTYKTMEATRSRMVECTWLLHIINTKNCSLSIVLRRWIKNRKKSLNRVMLPTITLPECQHDAE